MTTTAEILADSVHTYLGRPRRITTFSIRFHRFVLSELNTHKIFSRNSASSRAIPVEKMIADVLNDPAIPVFWGKNQKGMSAAVEMDPAEIELAKSEWLEARDAAVQHVRKLIAAGLHKQTANRILEPWMHTTTIVTSTDWANFYQLRRDSQAQPEMRALADAMYATHKASVPVDRSLLSGVERWHLPLVRDFERAELGSDAVKVSVGRCARVSYLTHEGKRDPAADIELHDRLANSGHWSPFEHPALPGDLRHYGNFYAWEQYRKMLTAEHPYYPGQTFPPSME